MKYAVLAPFAALFFVAGAFAQPNAQPKPMYRCDGNHYTDDVAEAKSRNCKLFTGGNITVIGGTKVQTPASGPVRVATAPQAAPGPRVDGAEQRSRDGEARSILEAELRKAEARQAELLKEYNNGEPEKQGAESRNYQKYLDRVAEMKASIARNDSDIAGLRRELGRTAPTATR